MKIEQNKVGMINYSLTDSEGNLIDSSNGQALAYLHGHSNLIPGLEKELEGKGTGDKFNANIPASEAYGEVEPNLIQEAFRKACSKVSIIWKSACVSKPNRNKAFTRLKSPTFKTKRSP